MSKYTVIEKPAIQYLCGLIRDLANVSEGIDDLNLRSDGTFSSVKIDTLLNTLKTDCNEYTDRLVANLSRLELKIANAESEITQPNIMYLYKPAGATSYEQYVVIEGTKVLLGTCDIDMGNYYTKAQADAKFVLKTDFDSLKTKVDGKVDKTDIVDNLTSTDTNKPLSANQGKVLKGELDLKANDSEVIKKTNMTTTIDKTSTADTVPTSKAVYDNVIMNRKIKTYTSLANIGLPTDRTATLTQIFSTLPDESILIAESKNIIASDLPNDFGMLEIIKLQTTRPSIRFIEKDSGYIHIMGITHAGVPTGNWKRLCTTTISDVSKTTKTPTFPSNVVVGSGGAAINYVVRNGWCNVNFVFNITSSTTFSWTDITTGLPIPANSVNTVLMSEGGKATQPIAIKITSAGAISSRIASTISTEDWWAGNIIYPVAES